MSNELINNEIQIITSNEYMNNSNNFICQNDVSKCYMFIFDVITNENNEYNINCGYNNDLLKLLYKYFKYESNYKYKY